MARFMGDNLVALEWETRAKSLRNNFAKDYCDTTNNLIIDHLNADGSRDMQVRPNQLYTYELIDNYDLCRAVTRRVWEELVYPWGVGSLSQMDDDFHPQHENWHYYHKDDAYHNGTVWLWNNGHAMQRMIEMGQPDIAWQLFKNMNRQALAEGAIGSLSENADAHPREGETWAKRSGTFLQAWSNAEQLRVWYQHFLGIRPDMVNGVVTVNPQLPTDITSLTYSQRIGKGDIIGTFERTDELTAYGYILRNEAATLRFDIPLYDTFEVAVQPGEIVLLKDMNGKLTIKHTAQDGTVVNETTIDRSEGLVKQATENNAFFEGTQFCTPIHRDDLKAFDTYYEDALAY